MANYKVNKNSITILGELTSIEEQIVALYMKQGKKVHEKRKSTAIRVSNDDIVKYFDDKKDETGKAEYEAQKNVMKKDKNGKERKQNVIGAIAWFHNKYPEAYEAIKANKSK